MKIIFNLHNVGLGNNGGSRTLLLCAENLALYGDEVVMFSNHKSKYSWHKPKGIHFAYGNTQPKCDVAIATGYKSVSHVRKSNADRKYYYIRGHELWQQKHEKLVKSYKSLKCIVNSEWLQKLLAENGVDSDIIYPGLDFEWFYSEKRNRSGFGALYHNRHKTKRHGDAVQVAVQTGWPLQMLNKHIKNASPKDTRRFYNKFLAWFAPTELEGLHNPPMEAALCGCALVCTDHPCGGMLDYARHNETALVYPARNLKVAANYLDRIMHDDALRMKLVKNMNMVLRQKIGDRITNMHKLREGLKT